MENGIRILLDDYRDIVVYGAGGVAKDTCRLLEEYCVKKNVRIAVTDIDGNPDFLEGYPVYPINELLESRYWRNALFIAAMMPSSANAVKRELTDKGCQNVMTAEEFAEIGRAHV